MRELTVKVSFYKKNDWSVNNGKSHFASTEQKLRKRTPEEVHLQMASENWQR